ncbi:hypothetical protein CN151_10585 [Sinorhizobium meliloti]|uniref:hypothetical protein n=1 Tax=Rhizobium meliloti TaxID=382 RepID=UPI000FD513D6|nr:hypothetical protein [Sinorhizobium meliloti]RVL05084.1 hypothetical protein CN151_10585 [Sinorhizobium meliloti]
MAIPDLIQEIENASHPNSELDARIALACGWRRRVREDNGGTRSVVWISDRREGHLPPFTLSVDAALQLLKAVDPDKKSGGGVSWVPEEGLATCGVFGLEYCHAHSVAMALCVAALKIRARETGGEH